MDRPEQAPHFPEGGQRNALNFQFSPEELKVLQECNREAFFQRSLPLGTLCGLGTWYAVQRGFFKPSMRFGAGPKVFVGITLGYFVGKLSYQNKCADKIMRIPNSRLADLIRQRRQGGGGERLLPDKGFGAGSMLSPFGPTSPSDSVTEEHYRRNTGDSFNLDVHVPQYSGLDDSGRPTIDSDRQFEEDLQLPANPPVVSKSYEELRRQNREDYIRRQQAPYRPPSLEDAPPIRREPERSAPKLDEQPQQPQVKNKYGDAWSQ